MSDATLPGMTGGTGGIGGAARRRSARPWERGSYALQPYLQRADRQDGAFVRWIEAAAAAPLARIRPGRGRLRRFAGAVLARGTALEPLDDAEFAAAQARLAARLRAEGPTPGALVESFALIREATGRHLGLRHYPSQLMAGRVLVDGAIAELATGEGKTITGLLPVITLGLSGLPVHVVTVNPYLVGRDAAQLRPVIESFGLSVGVVEEDAAPGPKRAAYRADVVFVTHKALCFDYLRDTVALEGTRSHARRLIGRALAAGAGAPPAPPMLRGLGFALLDEADLVLIDEARIPLIISKPGGEAIAEEECRRALDLAGRMEEGRDFRRLPRSLSVELTEAGAARAETLTAGLPGIWRAKRGREERLRQALTALHVFAPGRHYVVIDGAVQIVDEHTGRVSPGRAWEKGLHQMVEAKEGLDLTPQNETEARITYQRVFRRYMRLSGMTGTATGLETETMRVFGMTIQRIPTHRPLRRRDLGTRLFRRAEDRWAAVAERARAMAAEGRAVLVGTRSVASSEEVARRLLALGADPQVLNAVQDAEEAAIVAGAGRPGTITIATSMAGRGTDIALRGEVARRGGLHVIVTEPNESTRIDRQLVGRAGRQGDPGSAEALIALEDELFRAHAPRLARLVAALMGDRARELRGPLARAVLAAAQARAERANARIRASTLRSDRTVTQMLGFTGRSE